MYKYWTITIVHYARASLAPFPARQQRTCNIAHQKALPDTHITQLNSAQPPIEGLQRVALSRKLKGSTEASAPLSITISVDLARPLLTAKTRGPSKTQSPGSSKLKLSPWKTVHSSLPSSADMSKTGTLAHDSAPKHADWHHKTEPC